MVHKITIFLLFVLAMAAAGTISVHAEDDITVQVENRFEQKTKETRTFMESKRQGLMPTKIASGEVQLKRDEMKKKIEEMRDTMEKKREEARDRFEEQRKEFKEHISDIKDQRKKTIVENVDLRINEMNKKHTDTLSQVLSKVADILGRIEGKVATMEAEGTNTTDAKKAITDAKALIQTASVAITTQAGKEYIIDTSNASDEAKLRDDVKKTFMTFKSDITAVHEKVKAAREAVVHISKLYGQLHKEKVTP